MGHSFVSRLKHKLNTTSSSNPSRNAIALRVDRIAPLVFIRGRSGERVMNNDRMINDARQIRPDVVIIDTGSNDLIHNSTPLSVATRLITVGEAILKDNPLAKVVLCSALHRGRPTGPHSLLNDNIDLFNRILRNYCDVEPRMTYHTHRGFWTVPIKHWSTDYIHPNTHLGMSNYIKSIRRAILTADKGRISPLT